MGAQGSLSLIGSAHEEGEWVGEENIPEGTTPTSKAPHLRINLPERLRIPPLLNTLP